MPPKGSCKPGGPRSPFQGWKAPHAGTGVGQRGSDPVSGGVCPSAKQTFPESQNSLSWKGSTRSIKVQFCGCWGVRQTEGHLLWDLCAGLAASLMSHKLQISSFAYPGVFSFFLIFFSSFGTSLPRTFKPTNLFHAWPSCSWMDLCLFLRYSALSAPNFYKQKQKLKH